MRRFPSIQFLLPLALVQTAYAEGAAQPDWQDVGALFRTRCIMCHGEHGAGLGLRLDSYAAALKGSKNGPVIVPGDPDGSEMIRRLRGEKAPRMPFLGPPLPAEELALIQRWIEAGLPEGAGQ